jgi:hypothetical protein
MPVSHYEKIVPSTSPEDSIFLDPFDGDSRGIKTILIGTTEAESLGGMSGESERMGRDLHRQAVQS